MSTVAGSMPAELEINGVLYRKVGGVATVADRAERPDVKRAFDTVIMERLRTGQPWPLALVAQAKGVAEKTVRRDVGGVLVEVGTAKRKQGRKIFCNARSVAKYLGFEAEAARLAGA